MPEPVIHGIVGAQFGDLEFDVGKSVRWTQFYCDDLFILDINTGEQRYWVVNWAASFPEANHRVTDINYFRDPVGFRKEQFRLAQTFQTWSDNDWCLFVDAHEGLSFDNRSLPTDYNMAPFMSWVWREVDRAVTAGQDYARLPFFTYLRYGDLQNVTYGTQATNSTTVPAVRQALSVPYYKAYDSLVRLVKVSRLKNAGFDWASIDQPAAYTGTPKAQVISYGYAHWNMLDVDPGETIPEPLTAANDDGWRMRNLLSLARPLTGISFGSTWQNMSTDPASLPGPWAVDVVTNVDPTLATTVEEDGHTASNAAMAGIRTPLYDQAMRLNLRDGLWYERGASGNIPLNWDEVNQVWTPRYTPEEWEKFGASSSSEPEPAPSNLSLRLDGTVGTYVRTDDSNAFDFSSAFTMATMVGFDDWSPSANRLIVSKWGAAGQRSWQWFITPAGLGLTVSYNGTASSATFLLPWASTDITAPLDGSAMALAVSYTHNGIDLTDEARFMYSLDGRMWVTLGVVDLPNVAQSNIFNSTTQIQVGGDAAGKWRWLVLCTGAASGAGELRLFSGEEVGVFRGDLTLTPNYDRYGNIWSNVGTGWSYVAMANAPFLDVP